MGTLLTGERAPQKKGGKKRYSSKGDFAEMIKRQRADESSGEEDDDFINL